MDDDTRTQLDQITVTSQSDLQRMWELLMQPLGFRSTTLWVTFIDSADRPIRFLLEIAESDELPAPDEIANLFAVLQQVIDEEGDAMSVAFLITHPGRGALTAYDRALSARLLAGARSAGVACRPVHVADDVGIRAVAPDDLAA